MEDLAVNLEKEVNRLVDEYRVRCLWFLRPGYYPAGKAEQLQVLGQIAKHGDRAAFLRAGELRKWVSQNSSGVSAGS